MKTVTIANGTKLTLSRKFASCEASDLKKATPDEADEAERLASDESLWNEYVDPDATTPFDSEPYDHRVGICLLTIISNR